MGRERLTLAVGGMVCLVAAWPSSAQSLGEVARREAERRAEVPQPGRVYTNADLARDFTTTSAVPDPARAPAPAGPSPVSNADRAAADDDTGQGDAGSDEQDGVTPRDQQEPQAPSDRGEEYWRSRAELIRSRLAAKNREIESLRQRLASFGGGSGDPERDVAAQALARAVGDLDAFTDEWRRFERLARERGVPDTWIR